jgi:hypothetical protein
VDTQRRVNRAVLVACCGLLGYTPVWAEPLQQDQFQTDLPRDDQPQPKHKKRVIQRLDPAVQLRHALRDEINSGLVGIVSEGTDYTVDLALALTSKQIHLRLLPIAGAGAAQNAKDVIFARRRFCHLANRRARRDQAQSAFSGRREISAIRDETL